MIRTVKFQDARAIANIYNEYIKHSVISFETEPLSLQEMQSRIVEISAHFPYYVYEQQDGEIYGKNGMLTSIHWRRRYIYLPNTKEKA